jgi:geranylgeranyl diphosphate synthase type II
MLFNRQPAGIKFVNPRSASSERQEPAGIGVATAPDDPASAAVPPDKAGREQVLAAVRRHAAESELVPPLTLEELRQHAAAVMARDGIVAKYSDFVTVLVSNEIWRATLASIPFERRVLLLPQCLRTKTICPAAVDEMGLLCAQCGTCATGTLQAEAEALGYVVLVAEGTTIVTKLLEQGRVDAVIGVSCLSVLERAFRHMAAHAIPGLAIPLYRDGCDHSLVDLDWIREALYLQSRLRWLGRIDIDRLRAEVESWFPPDRLRITLGKDGTRTEEIALAWLGQSGKRWRPLLAVCVYQALTETIDEPLSPSIQHLALATECFHKASLVHDDIEDGDDFRYGDLTLHRRYGIPIALNVGDFLLGEGYRLIAECEVSPEQKARLLAVVAEGHRHLAIGQGEELWWRQNPVPLPLHRVLDLFRHKTAPAFAVVSRTLTEFSEALGIAYQIRDDLDDFYGQNDTGDFVTRRPSVLYALAYDTAVGVAKEEIADAWRLGPGPEAASRSMRRLITELHVEDQAQQLFEHYRNETIRSLGSLRSPPLKGLLRRVVAKILGGT